METTAPQTKPMPHTHRFKAEADGFRVLGVPVFANHERTVRDSSGRSRTLVYGKKDLDRIAKVMNFRAKNDKFQQAVHGDHTDLPGRHKRLAFSTNYRVEPYVFEGGPRWVIVADWIARDKKALLALEDFPYRSVEVSPATGEFSSLAVMESQGPYFKFPLFKLEGVPAEWRAEYEAERSQFNYSDDELVLYREDTEDAMESMQKPEDPKANYNQGMPPGQPMQPGQGQQAQPGGDDNAPVTRGEFMAIINEIMQAIKGGAQQQAPIQPVVNHSDTLSPAQQQAVQAFVEGALVPYREMAESYDETQRVVVALAQRTELQDLISSANARTAHVSRPHDFEEQLTQKYNDGGRQLAESFLSGMLIGAPPSAVSDQSTGGEEPAGSSIPDELLPYRDSPTAFKAARELYDEFADMPASLKRGVTAKQHIENNIGPVAA